LAAADPTPADLERDLRRTLVEEHLKLAEKCMAADLAEEARAEYADVLRADPQHELARRVTSSGGRLWSLHWDKALHEKYLDYRELRRILAYEVSSRLLALGLAKKKQGDAAGARTAWLRALDYDPEFAEAHTQLGEVRVEGQGWFPKAEAEKRAAGLLPFAGKWLPAAEVALKRRKWGDAWEVSGKHFVVKSNHSLEAAQRVLGWAEDMYTVLLRETAPVFSPPADVKPFAVFLFATKEEFDAHVRDSHAGGVSAGAIGFYSNEDRAAHFWYRDDEGVSPLSTIVHHECLHQVLDAWIPWKNAPTLCPHFWIYEGLARWFESVENRDGKLLVADPKFAPFQVARGRVEKGTAIPLEKLVMFEQADMDTHYDQAAGVTLFFMNAGQGAYREKFLRYCAIVLGGEARADSFEKAFGEKPEEFETAWREYLRGLK
ncbi:MAG: tetratricopeptide repeat protein, partial [Planctomycetes bacterium]|nr:tetratricopeptide repeat protein [Planctomycetota bacterium]